MSVVVSIVLQRQRRLRERDTTRQKDERTRWEWTIIASIVIGKGEARAGAGAGGGIEVVAVLEKRDAFLKQRPWSVLPSFSSSSLSSLRTRRRWFLPERRRMQSKFSGTSQTGESQTKQPPKAS